jgi:hypothetical protein
MSKLVSDAVDREKARAAPPLTAPQLLKIAKMMNSMVYDVFIETPPKMSRISIYDDTKDVIICEISLPCYLQKDLDAIARHNLRFLRMFQFEIYRTEHYEKMKHQQTLEKKLFP